MRTARLVSWVLAAMLMLRSALGEPPQGGRESGPTASVALQDFDQSLGPFVIAGQSFTILLHGKSVNGTSASVLARTIAKVEIRDHSGAAIYEKTFPYQIEGASFRQAVSVSARLLPGDNLTGLLLAYTTEPATPGKGQSWQFFGFRNGKLALFDPPGQEPAMNSSNGFAGVLMMTANGPRPMPMPIRGPLDTVELRAWTGNYYIIVPMRVDWRAGKLIVGQQCLESGGGPGLHEVGCEMRVEAERVPSSSDMNFARVFQNPQEQNGVGVQHAVIAKGAEVQLLKAKSLVKWVVDGDVMRIQFPDLWLKVLIDNNTENEGWIQGEQDLAAIGLPARSAIP